jgi:ketosteroid isomerase-like protein
MSQENVEVVRRAYRAWSEGDFETLIQACDPGVELHLPEGGLNVGIRRGREAIRQFLQGLLEVWGDLSADPDRSEQFI